MAFSLIITTLKSACRRVSRRLLAHLLHKKPGHRHHADPGIDRHKAPGVIRKIPAFKIGTVPRRGAARGTYHCRQPFRASRIAPSVEVKKVKRAAEAFNLDLCSFYLRLSQIIEDP